MISNCGHDENGRYHGGQAGDQDGTEWQVRSWYNRPWDEVWEPPSREVGEEVAYLAEGAAENDCIGYDQDERTTFFDRLMETLSYDPREINQECETDCSAGVAAIVNAAGKRLGIPSMSIFSKDHWTGSLGDALAEAGWVCHTASQYRTSDEYVGRGWILLNVRSHVAINIGEGGSCEWGNGGTSYTPNSDTPDAHSGSAYYGSVAGVQEWLNDNYGTGLDVDGLYGPLTKAALTKALQTELNRQYGAGLDVDGIYGPRTKAACCIIERGDRGNITQTLQGALICNGYSTGGFDGIAGEITDRSIRDYQRSHGLEVDGQAGPNTFESLLA